MAPQILLIEDEMEIRRFLRASLVANEYELIEAATGEEGIRLAATRQPDLIILDLGLPDMDGLEVTRRLREWSKTPMIVLSARLKEGDKIAALDAGADDYLTKPFGIGELLARIRVALRHALGAASPQSEAVFVTGELRVDLAKRRVFVGEAEIHLTPIEYKLLVLLVQHAGKVLTHPHLLREVWGPGYANESHYLRVYMGQLRHKLEADPARPKYLLNEPGVGYRLALD
jgi:two-component system, OmpR family, KDP operon response regulator KdpE